MDGQERKEEDIKSRRMEREREGYHEWTDRRGKRTSRVDGWKERGRDIKCGRMEREREVDIKSGQMERDDSWRKGKNQLPIYIRILFLIVCLLVLFYV